MTLCTFCDHPATCSIAPDGDPACERCRQRFDPTDDVKPCPTRAAPIQSDRSLELLSAARLISAGMPMDGADWRRFLAAVDALDDVEV